MKSLKLNLLCCGGLSLILDSALLLAEVPIKRLIVHDCARAATEFSKLNEAERDSLLPFMRLVLKMDLIPDDSIAMPTNTPPNTPGSLINHTNDHSKELGAPSVIYGLVASPESSAKRCAVSLITEMGISGAQALPELILLADDVSAPAVVRDEASYLARSIVDAISHRATAPEFRPLLEGLLDVFIDTSSSLAYQFISELAEPTTTVILERLASASVESRGVLIELLFSSNIVSRVWDTERLEFLLSQDTDVRARLASSVGLAQALSQQQWSVLLSLARDNELAVREAFVTSLARIEPSHLKEFFATQPSVALLINLLSSSSKVELDGSMQTLANTPYAGDEIERSLVALLQSKGNVHVERVMRILASKDLKHASSVKVLTDFAYQNDINLRSVAIVALSSASIFKKEVLSTLLRLLKRNKAEIDTNSRLLTVQMIGVALAKLAPTRSESEAFLPYLFDNMIDGPKLSEFNREIPKNKECHDLNGAECGLLFIALVNPDAFKRLERKASAVQIERIKILKDRLEQLRTK